MPAPTKKLKNIVPVTAPVKSFVKFDWNCQFLTTVSPALHSFSLRVFNSKQTAICSYTHPTADHCNAITYGKLNDAVLLGLALDSGVLLYSISESIPKQHLVGVHQAPVTDFCFSLDSKSGYSVSSDGLLVEWDLSTNSKKNSLKSSNLSKVAINEKGTLLAIAGNQIHIVDLKTFKIIKNFPGHTTLVSELIFVGDDLFSSAVDDRFITRWNSEKKPLVFSVESPPISMSVNSQNHLLAQIENGVVSLWKTDRTSKRAVAADGLLELNAEDKAEAAFLAASLDNDQVVVAYGTLFKPIFERVSFTDEEGVIKPATVLTRLVLEQSKKQKKKRTSEKVPMQVLGSIDFGENSKKSEVTEETIAEEPTIEDQVKALVVEDHVKENKESTNISLNQMLSQAISSGDKQLLERVLSNSDPKIINATIRRINPTLVVPLLDALVVRLQKRPNRAAQLVEWIRACLLNHSGYLLSIPQRNYSLRALHRTLIKRQEVLPKLLRLSGRLDMISCQMNFQSNDQEDEDLVVFDADVDETSDMDEYSGEDEEEMVDYANDFDMESDSESGPEDA
ncbi:WD40-repeat-containing domain protein [Globomyces pollinis-pini]|nr:WD40-repeat-containing domain protein [Globomyces pollinis-pini]